MQNSKVAICLVTYNNPTLLVRQVELIHKYCLDDFDIWVIDNSTEKDAIAGIKHHADRLKCNYLKTNAGSRGGSASHSFAANTGYKIISSNNEYGYYFFCDHDMFCIRCFSVTYELGDKVIAGIGQNKSKTYFWPGCVMFKKDEDIDFSCNGEFGLDTGGNLYKMIDKHGLDKCIFFDEAYHENDQYHTTSQYNYYTTINKDMWLHFTNASNWNPIDRHEERINSLLNILESRTNDKAA